MTTPPPPPRERLEARWLRLVRRELPAAAAAAGRRWPVRLDHCFARILLDAVCEAPWRERVRPPAYRNLPDAGLAAAVALAEAALAGGADLRALNERSLAMRRSARARAGASLPLGGPPCDKPVPSGTANAATATWRSRRAGPGRGRPPRAPAG